MCTHTLESEAEGRLGRNPVHADLASHGHTRPACQDGGVFVRGKGGEGKGKLEPQSFRINTESLLQGSLLYGSHDYLRVWELPEALAPPIGPPN